MRPYFSEEDIQQIQTGFEKILRSGRLTLGEYTSQFEEEFARYVGTRYSVAANSGTSSLEMIYRSIGIEGKEVIVPTNTHIATPNAVLYAGGKPVLADIESESLCLDIEDAFSKVTKSTKAIVVVHLAGLIHPKIRELQKQCEELNLFLIEDAAHAHGAIAEGKKAGSLSRAASFSFYPAKVLTSVEGGMVTSDDESIAEISKQLRNHGTDSRGLQVRLGYNWRMSELHSLVGLFQLRRIEEIIRKKNEIASIYDNEFKDYEKVKIIRVPRNFRHSYYKYPLVLEKGIDFKRVQDTLKKDYLIETGTIYYPPCHLQPIYQTLFPNVQGKLPVSEDILARTISLPIHAGMSEDDALYVAESLLETIQHLR
jgi:perosamine synthetase